MVRSSGILLHPTLLPSPFGIGDLGPEAFKFVDFLVAAGQTLWQAHQFKDKILARAYERFRNTDLRASFEAFVQQQHYWLDDYALFRALKDEDGKLSRIHHIFRKIIECAIPHKTFNPVCAINSLPCHPLSCGK